MGLRVAALVALVSGNAAAFEGLFPGPAANPATWQSEPGLHCFADGACVAVVRDSAPPSLAAAGDRAEDDDGDDLVHRILVARSAGAGAEWADVVQLSAADSGGTEPRLSCVESAQTRLCLAVWSEAAGAVRAAESRDGGSKWSTAPVPAEVGQAERPDVSCFMPPGATGKAIEEGSCMVVVVGNGGESVLAWFMTQGASAVGNATVAVDQGTHKVRPIQPSASCSASGCVVALSAASSDSEGGFSDTPHRVAAVVSTNNGGKWSQPFVLGQSAEHSAALLQDGVPNSVPRSRRVSATCLIDRCALVVESYVYDPAAPNGPIILAWVEHSRSQDGGASWRALEPLTAPGANKTVNPALSCHASGGCAAVWRTTGVPNYSLSATMGESWDDPQPFNVPQGNASLAALEESVVVSCFRDDSCVAAWTTGGDQDGGNTSVSISLLGVGAPSAAPSAGPSVPGASAAPSPSPSLPAGTDSPSGGAQTAAPSATEASDEDIDLVGISLGAVAGAAAVFGIAAATYLAAASTRRARVRGGDDSDDKVTSVVLSTESSGSHSSQSEATESTSTGLRRAPPPTVMPAGSAPVSRSIMSFRSVASVETVLFRLLPSRFATLRRSRRADAPIDV